MNGPKFKKQDEITRVRQRDPVEVHLRGWDEKKTTILDRLDMKEDMVFKGNLVVKDNIEGEAYNLTVLGNLTVRWRVKVKNLNVEGDIHACDVVGKESVSARNIITPIDVVGEKVKVTGSIKACLVICKELEQPENAILDIANLILTDKPGV